MSLYFCDGCTEIIPAQKARISCRECHNYDLCANCAVLGTTTGAHLSSHQTALHRTSGFANIPPPPPGKPTNNPAGVSPAVAATVPDQRGQSTSSWTQFFNGNTWQHTDSFAKLTAAIFERLVGGTGYMTPEAHSALLDLLGTPLNENAWKQALQSGIGPNRESQADNVLKQAYDLLSIDHILRPRQTTTSSSTQSSFRSSLLNTFISAAMPVTQMPLLTLSGFTEFCKIQALSDPDKARNQFNIVIRHYDLAIWRERGEIPRWVLPPGPVPEMLQRIAQIQARALATTAARNQNSAARIQLHDAQIQRAAESQQRMGDIGTGYYTEYYYRPG